MSLVPGPYASWLKADALYVDSVIGGADARWGDAAVTTEVLTPLVDKTDAQAVGAYVATFLYGPIARDAVVIEGQRADLIFQCIRVLGDRLGYEGAGSVAFVIGAAEGDTTTTLTVLKRL